MMSANEVYSVANWILIGALVLGVIATYAVVVSGKIKEGRLKQELSQANERAANALQKAEEERLARVKLEERVSWRRLTTEQQSEIGARFSHFSGQLSSI